MRKTKLEFVVYPARDLACSILEPINTTLAAQCMLEHSDCAFILDN